MAVRYTWAMKFGPYLVKNRSWMLPNDIFSAEEIESENASHSFALLARSNANSCVMVWVNYEVG